jgi:hypothetical protein
MKAGIVEPEETAVTIPYKHACDMRHDIWKSEYLSQRRAAETAVARERLDN